ncbi:MAG: hypothetical protein AB7I27_07440 [Bacteriovoracaceae bacterium]
MMAETKFKEAEEALSELLLKSSEREIIHLYLECLQQQNKYLPTQFVFQVADENIEWLDKISPADFERNFNQLIITKIAWAENNGKLALLYQLISEFQIRQFESQRPYIPTSILKMVEKYFKNDFQLNLQRLAIEVCRNDIQSAESILKNLIIHCHERQLKQLNEKFESILKIIKIGEAKSPLEIYVGYLYLYLNGIKTKSDYKKLVELIIYFDEFKFEIYTLNLMHMLNLKAESSEYAQIISKHDDYSFVYLDKFFPQLKSYFFKKKIESLKNESQSIISDEDLKIDIKEKIEVESESQNIETEEYEYHEFKFNEYSFNQLCDLATGFIQANMPKNSLCLIEKAFILSPDDHSYLKLLYLKLTCLLHLKDYRAALDVCFEALTKTSEMEDILSFLYGQAEIYLKLNQKESAKKILEQIMAIKSDYRLTRERLQKLNEV